MMRRLVLSVALLAAAGASRADVLLMNDGSMLLGRLRSMTAGNVEMAIGAAGSATVRKADVRLLIPCSPADEPDSYYKAGMRAEKAGLIQDALACYEKSVASESATVAAAASSLAILRDRLMGAAKSKMAGAPKNDIERRRAEAHRLIAEGERILRGARMATGYRSVPGWSNDSVRGWGESLRASGLTMLQQGSNMLAQIEKETAPPPPPPKAEPPPEPTLGEKVSGWFWPIVYVVIGLIVLRVLLHPFISKR